MITGAPLQSKLPKQLKMLYPLPKLNPEQQKAVHTYIDQKIYERTIRAIPFFLVSCLLALGTGITLGDALLAIRIDDRDKVAKNLVASSLLALGSTYSILNVKNKLDNANKLVQLKNKLVDRRAYQEILSATQKAIISADSEA